MASKNKGGREARKPKQAQNKKTSGQTPSVPLADVMNRAVAAGKK